jgi:hypothetical protein
MTTTIKTLPFTSAVVLILTFADGSVKNIDCANHATAAYLARYYKNK